MIYVGDVVSDPDMGDPEPWTVLRSTGSWVLGGFDTVTTPLTAWGPNRQASNREIAMLPEADRVGSIRAFYWTQPMYLTRNTAPVPSVHGETPTGAIPGTVYQLTTEPPGAQLSLYQTGLLLTPALDYTLEGTTVTLTAPTVTGDTLYAQWPITAFVAPAASDVIVYGNRRHRVLQIYRVGGSGYWKALASREEAA